MGRLRANFARLGNPMQDCHLGKEPALRDWLLCHRCCMTKSLASFPRKSGRGEGGPSQQPQDKTSGQLISIFYLLSSISYILSHIPSSAHSQRLSGVRYCLFPGIRPAVPGRIRGGCRRFPRSQGSSPGRCGTNVRRAGRR